MASEPGGGQPPPTVLLDANLLYPFHLRNLLVQFGVDLLIRPRLTERIHYEWIGTLAATGKVTRERLLRTRGIMERVLPGADVLGWERRLPDVPDLPDPDDRHVVAALEAPAPTILTLNLRGFPASLLAPLGVAAEHPDAFLSGLHDTDPEAVCASAKAAHANFEPQRAHLRGFPRRAGALGIAGLHRSAARPAMRPANNPDPEAPPEPRRLKQNHLRLTHAEDNRLTNPRSALGAACASISVIAGQPRQNGLEISSEMPSRMSPMSHKSRSLSLASSRRTDIRWRQRSQSAVSRARIPERGAAPRRTVRGSG